MANKYLEGIRVPVLLYMLWGVLAYFVSAWLYKGVTGPEDISGRVVMITIIGIGIGLLTYVIPIYAGWAFQNKFKGPIKEAAILGVILGGIQFVVGSANTVLLYMTNAGYKAAMPGFDAMPTGMGTVMIVSLVVGLLIGIPWALVKSGALTALGAFISTKQQK